MNQPAKKHPPDKLGGCFFALLRNYKIVTLEKFDVAAIFRKTV